MLEAERHRLIVKLVKDRSVVSISDILELVGSSEATVRRDINALAKLGKIRRIRGGAEAVVPRHESHLVGPTFMLNKDVNAASKQKIAQAAAALIQDSDSIIINGGTTTFALVEFLADRQLDILTNSIPIVTELLTTSRNRVVIPGGTIYREQSIVLSPYESDAISHFYAEKLFTSCYGLNRSGMMEADPLIVQAEMKLLKRADELIVMADSSKLRRRSSMVVANLDQISTLITDDKAEEEDLDVFREAGINVIVTI